MNAPHRDGDGDDDATLEARFHAGDADAFRALAEPHLDTLYTLCLRMLGNRTAADDVSQDTLLRALSRHALYDPGRPFRPWLLTIAANLCRNELRRAWWRSWLPLSGGEESAADGPEEVAENAQVEEQIRDALAALDPMYREAVTLFHLDGMTYEEMQQITGIAIPALKQRVRRGRLMMQKNIFRLYPERTPPRNTEQE